MEIVMNIIKPGYEIITPIDYGATLRELEKIGRVCYKSEDRITDDSAASFISRIVASGHGSVIEHSRITVKFICDRGVTHEIVRHRIASYSQESTRYCNIQRINSAASLHLSDRYFGKPILKNMLYGLTRCRRLRRAIFC